MKNHRVEMTQNAELEIAEVFAWIAPLAPENALRWVSELEQRIESLATMPGRGKRAPEQDQFDVDVRQIIHDNYRVIYSVEPGLVRVLHVCHVARLPFGD